MAYLGSSQQIIQAEYLISVQVLCQMPFLVQASHFIKSGTESKTLTGWVVSLPRNRTWAMAVSSQDPAAGQLGTFVQKLLIIEQNSELPIFFLSRPFR